MMREIIVPFEDLKEGEAVVEFRNGLVENGLRPAQQNLWVTPDVV